MRDSVSVALMLAAYVGVIAGAACDGPAGVWLVLGGLSAFTWWDTRERCSTKGVR